MILLNNFHLWRRITVALIVFISAFGLLWAWLGNASPQGEPNLWCDSENIAPQENSAGWIVSGHNTVCSGFGGSSAVYIYVHPIDKQESREFLVFRYFEHGGANPAKMKWLGRDKLLIQVEQVSEVTKKIPSMGPIRIYYEIGKEDYEETK